MKFFICLSAVLAVAVAAPSVVQTTLLSQNGQLNPGVVVTSSVPNQVSLLRLAQNNNQVVNLDNNLRRVDNLQSRLLDEQNLGLGLQQRTLNDQVVDLQRLNQLRNLDDQLLDLQRVNQLRNLNDQVLGGQRLDVLRDDVGVLRNNINNLRGEDILARRNEQLRVAAQVANAQLNGLQQVSPATALLTRTRLAQSLAGLGNQGVASASSSNVRVINGRDPVTLRLQNNGNLRNLVNPVQNGQLVVLNDGQVV